MKKIYLLLLLPLMLLLGTNFSANAQQSVLDPNDTVVNYDAYNPPALPTAAGVMVKWVRTPLMSWNTLLWKPYFYSTGPGNGIAFRLLFPKSYASNPNKKYPMLIFFHGAGEISRNSFYDNELQLVNCGQKIMSAVSNGSFDGFVLFPQTTSSTWDKSFSAIRGIVNYMALNNRLDKSWITVSGLSMGGTAAWNFSKANPDLVAGVTPISSNPTFYSNINIVDSLQDVPIWLSQGGLDTNPLQSTSDNLVSSLRNSGLDVRYTVYPNSGHGVWDNHYAEPDAFSWMLKVNKTNPHVYYGKTEFCLGDPVRDTLGITAGFQAYEWSKNGVVITGANTNTLIISDTGTYAARYKVDGNWTYWSPQPVDITYKAFTQTPPIQVSGLMSRVIPAPDGNSFVVLALPPGFSSYQWRNSKGDIVGADSLYKATQPGNYIATVTELSGCPAKPSDSFYVAANSGPNPPDPASNLNGNALSQTAIQLEWSNNIHPVYNETAFEVYRGNHVGGPYELVGIVPADTLNYTDRNLSPNKSYYYVVRAVDRTGAAAISNELHLNTQVDSQAPTAPSNLKSIGSTPSTVLLEWNASTDNVAVTQYGIYINGVRSYITTDTKYTVRNLIHGQTYAFTVKAFDSTGNISPASNQIVASAVYHGLAYKYYTYTGSWPSLPTLSSLVAADSGMVSNITLTPAEQSTNYALSFQGYINIRVAGDYVFSTSSDDGSMLYINNSLIVNNDGLHGTQSKSGNYTFSQPGLYPFRLDYYQEGGGAVLTASWQRTSNPQFSTAQIPDSAFIETITLGGSAPSVPTNVTAQAISYDTISLSWKDTSLNETGFEIYRSIKAAGTYQIIATTKANISSFVDTTVSPSTTYYYKVQAINQYGSSGYNIDATHSYATTLGLPSPPAAPVSLTATVLSSDRIRLAWPPSSDDVSSFDVYRSDDGGLQYRKLTTLSRSSVSYLDSLLYGNTVYFYKIDASNVGGVSGFSNEVNATTLNNNPHILSEDEYYIPYDTTTKVALNASDKDNEVLTLKAVNLPDFGSFTDNGDRTGTFTFSPSKVQQGNYPAIKVIVTDQHGGSDSATFSLTVNSMYPPVIQPVLPLTVNTSEFLKDTVRLEGGTQGDGITWQTQGMPAFIDTARSADGGLILELAPGANDSGHYTFHVIAANSYRMNDTVPVEVTVMNVPLRKWYLNLASNYSWMAYPGSPWNNIRGVVTAGLLDDQGNTSSVGLNFLTTWWATNTNGAQTGNNSGIYADNVLRDYYYFGKDGGPNQVVGKITGLDSTKSYVLTFFASSTWAFTKDNGHTVFQVGDQRDSIAVQANTSKTLSFANIRTAGDGSISFTMIRGADAGAGYLNSIVISTQASIPPGKPTNIQLTNQTVNGANAVRVGWDPGSDNANTIEIYRSTSRNSGYLLLDEGLENGNSHNYTDTSVAPTTSQTYYYYLMATNEYGKSASTDTVSISTVQYVDTRKWYVNFASNYSWMVYPGAPWNNIRGLTATGLLDDQGQSSNVGLAFQTTWWATNTNGAQTGNNSGVYADNVLRDYYYFGKDGGPSQVTATVTGLDPSKTYIITFFASSVWRFTPNNGHTVFEVGARRDSVDVEGNISRTVTFSNLIPSSSGAINFIMSKGTDAGAGYLNAMVISTQTSIPPTAPNNLQLSNEIVSGGNAVRVGWQVTSDNAKTIEIYRSTQRNSGYTLLNDGLNNGSSNTYTDTSVSKASSVTYYYYLVATNMYGSSATTDTGSITTSQYIDTRAWYLNLASNYSWMTYPGSPWNNIRGVVTNGLLDNLGQNSSVGLNLQTTWWATNTNGAQTGNNSGIYADNVLRDYYYFGKDGGPNQVIGTLTGLDPNKSYELTFFASSTWAFTKDNGHTVFQVGSQKDSIAVQGNTDKILTFSNVIPTSDGTINFTMSKATDAGAGYLNSLIVKTQANTAPAPPINLHLVNQIQNGTNAIKISWQPGSNNTDSIHVFRAIAKEGPYLIMNSGQSGMDSTYFIDTTVSSKQASTYYYYLKGSNAYGNSIPSDTESITTATLFPTAPANLVATTKVVNHKYAVAIGWKLTSDNAKEIDVYRSMTLNGHYTLVGSPLVSANPTGYVDTSVSLGSSYYYYLDARNEFAISSVTDTVSVAIPNTAPPLPPIINSVGEVFLAAGLADTVAVSTTVPDEVVTFSIDHAPAFVSLNATGNNAANIFINPAASDIGDYDSLRLIAADLNGGADTVYFSLHITDGNVLSKIYLNFTIAGYTYANPWNNILFSSGGNTAYANLTNGFGQQTGVALTALNAWSGTQANGSNTFNNSGIVPDSVMATGFYIGDANTRTLKISGLSSNLKYNLIFFASSNSGGNTDYTTNYTVNGKTVSLNGIRNTDQVVRINGLIPDSSKSLTITVSKGTNASQGLLNAMIIESADDGALISPNNLTAKAGQGNVMLHWADRSNNEQKFDVLRATISDGTYTNIGNVGANVTSFVDQNVIANTRYFYKIVAISSDGLASPSEIASVTTPQVAIYVNFNLKESPAPSPWNNTQAPPQSGAVYGPMLDINGQNTGITLNMGANFEGENPVGYSSGNNSGLYPDLVTSSCYYMDNGLDTVVMNISNLNMVMRYDLTFYGSILGYGWQNTTQFIANNQTVGLETSYNSANTVTLSNLSPDANGQITVKIIYTRQSTFAVLNAMIIQGHDNYDDHGNKIIDPSLYMRIKQNNALTINSNIKQTDESVSSPLKIMGNVYPNPFRDLINIKVTSPQDGTIEISLYSINGQVVDRYLKSLGKGINSIEYRPNGDLKPGAYILSLKLVGTQKIINVKLIKR